MPGQPPAITQTISAAEAGQTILAWLRRVFPDLSWSQCRQVLSARRVTINRVVAIHEGRRLAAGDIVEVRSAGSAAPRAERLQIVFVDQHIVVVEKPPGVVSTRRPEELQWPLAKRLLDPTLDELTSRALLEREQGPLTAAALKRLGSLPRLWRVQRLDRDTSGVMVFARTVDAARELIQQFSSHSVERKYRAIVHGLPTVGRIESRLVRDRGDGLRGSANLGQLAITHILTVAPIGRLSLIECRLETGRTHQIRIHLAEQGHPVCGDDRYLRQRDGNVLHDASGAPRLALHATMLAVDHPVTRERLSFASDWPQDLAQWLHQRATE